MIFLDIEVLYYFLPLIVLLGFFIFKKSKANNYFSKEILDKIIIRGDFIGSKNRNILFFISLILMLFALARPVSLDKNRLHNEYKSEVLVIFDISLSMLANDVYPNRLESAKEILKRLNLHLKNSDIGVVAFAKNAFIISPLTYDKDNLDFLISNISSDLTTVGGSDIQNALEKALEFAKNIKEVLIITDGAEFDKSNELIKIAKENSLKVHAITLGTQIGSQIIVDNEPLKDMKNSIVITKGNPWLENVTSSTRGVHLKIPSEMDKFNDFANNIGTLDVKIVDIRSEDIKELFYYPLGLAILLLFMVFNSFPKINKNLVLFVILTSLGSDLKAFDFINIQKANNYAKKGEFEKSANEFSKVDNIKAKYNRANMLYKAKKYQDAIELYEEVLARNVDFAPIVLHNLGNAYANDKQLTKAKESFQRALKLQEDADTRANLNYINNLLEEESKKQSPLDKLKEGSQMQLEKREEGDRDGDPSKNKGIKKR